MTQKDVDLLNLVFGEEAVGQAFNKMVENTEQNGRLFGGMNIGETQTYEPEPEPELEKSEVKSEVKPPSRYPLTDICTDEAETLFIEIALAGFSKEDITIEPVGDMLYIRGVYDNKGEDLSKFNYQWENISKRDFERKIVLEKEYRDLNNISVTFDDGILTIMIIKSVAEIPERKFITID